jgi:hypothetical protein
MRAKIKKVEPASLIDGKAYILWIYAKLTSGKIIKIFDDIPFDLTSFIGKNVNIFIESGSYTLVNDRDCEKNDMDEICFKGKLFSNFKINPKWKEANWLYDDSYEFYKKNLQPFKADDGIIHLSGGLEQIKKEGINEGEINMINFTRLNITAWLPIDE